MRPLTRVLGPTLALTLVACEDARDPLDLGALVEPGDACVTVVHDQLDLGETLHRFVSDGPGSAGGWGLITFINDNELSELGIVRVPASPDELATQRVGLGLTATDPKLVELRAGEVPGELWVSSRTADVAVLRRLEPEIGLSATNGMLGLFPAQGSGDCPEFHHRTLVLIEGRPHLLAIPNCSDTPALDMHFVELDRDTLEFGTSWQLSFDPCAGIDPISCAQMLAYTLASVGPGTSSPLADATRVAVGFVQVRAIAGVTNLPGLQPASDVSLLDMRLTDTGPSARLVTFRGVWDGSLPVALTPAVLTQDPYSTLVRIRNQLLATDSALLRFDTVDELYIQLRNPELMPFGGRGQLIQLANQSAIVDLDEGSLRAVPLRDVETWPAWMSYELLEDPEVVAFEPAGVGHLLLRRDKAPAQVVHVACLD